MISTFLVFCLANCQAGKKINKKVHTMVLVKLKYVFKKNFLGQRRGRHRSGANDDDEDEDEDDSSSDDEGLFVYNICLLFFTITYILVFNYLLTFFRRRT